MLHIKRNAADRNEEFIISRIFTAIPLSLIKIISDYIHCCPSKIKN